LIRASIVSAALLCEAEQEVRDAMGRFGARIGLAFQVVDDILDVRTDRAAGKDSAHRRGQGDHPALTD
jgi:geranylgeranyl diphosphate synthase type II